MQLVREQLELVFDFNKQHARTKAKTELCRALLQPRMMCKFHKCHFAHSIKELQPKVHSKSFFKSTKCMKFPNGCKYKVRCSYIHDEKIYIITSKTKVLFSRSERVFRIVHDQGDNNVAVYTLETDGNYQEKMSRDLIEALWALVKQKHRDCNPSRGSTPAPQILSERKMPITTMSREGTPMPIFSKSDPCLPTVSESKEPILQTIATNTQDMSPKGSMEKMKAKSTIISERIAGPHDFVTPEKSILEIPATGCAYTYSSRSSSPESDYWSCQFVESFPFEDSESWIDVRTRLENRIEELEMENTELRTRLFDSVSCEKKNAV